MMADWLDTLMQYDVDIRHRPGIEMVLSDSLSRMYMNVREERAAFKLKQASGGKKGKTPKSPALHARMAVLPRVVQPVARPDVELRKFVKERLNKETISAVEKQQEILRREHSEGHHGANELYKRVWNSGKYWPGMMKQCEDLVANCKSCLAHNVAREGFHPAQSLRADGIWQHVAIDTIVGLPETDRGNKHVLVMVDVLSRYLVALPLKDMRMSTVADKLHEIMMFFGPPKILQSDNGTEYVNKLVAEVCTKGGVDHRRVAAYNPRANGLAERFVQKVKVALKKRLEGEYSVWDLVLRGTVYDINRTTTSFHRSSPFVIFYGRAPGKFEDYSAAEMLANWPQLSECDTEEEYEQKKEAASKKAVDIAISEGEEVKTTIIPTIMQKAIARQEKKNAKLDGKRKLCKTLPVGTRVMLLDKQRASGLHPKYLGPYRVESVNRRGTYRLKRETTGQSYDKPVPISQLKVCKGDGPMTSATGEAVSTDTDNVFYVEDILEHRESKTKPGQMEYLVKY